MTEERAEIVKLKKELVIQKYLLERSQQVLDKANIAVYIIASCAVINGITAAAALWRLAVV